MAVNLRNMSEWVLPVIIVVILLVAAGVIIGNSGKKVEKYGAWGQTLWQWEGLETNQALISSDNSTRLVMQWDGNLVMYHWNQPIWASGTSWSGGNRNGYLCRMQQDGNLVVYNKDNWRAIWASGTQQWNWQQNRSGAGYYCELLPKCLVVRFVDNNSQTFRALGKFGQCPRYV